jgi:hypothetical protein
MRRADITPGNNVPVIEALDGRLGGNAANPQTGISSTASFLQGMVSGNEHTVFNPVSHADSPLSPLNCQWAAQRLQKRKP